MFNKFFSFTGCAFALIGVFAFVMSTDVQMMSSFENVWRTTFALMIFAGAIHVLFVAMRQNNPLLVAVALFEGAVAFTLAANTATTFADSSPAGNPTYGLIVIGAMLVTHGLTMIVIDGKEPSSDLALVFD